MFDNYKPATADLNQEVGELLTKIAGRVPEGSTPLAFVAGNIARNITSRPNAYLMFGPYWWAVKAILRESGFQVGDIDDPLIAKAYGAEALGGQLQLLVAANQFADHYRQDFLQGTRDFVLTEGAASYALYDADME